MWCRKSFFAISFIRLVGLLPLPLSRWVGRQLGSLADLLNTRMAKVTRENLRICFPGMENQQRNRLARKSLQATGMVAAEACYIWGLSPEKTAKLIIGQVGEQCVHDALNCGKGLIVLAPHLGNWEVLGLQLPKYGAVTNLYQPSKLPGLDQIIRQGRAKAGCELVPTNTKGVASILKTLKNNGISGILPDQNPNDPASGSFAPFFGEPAFTMVLIHKLIQRTQCKAVLAFAKRVDGGFELIYQNPPEDIYSSDQATSLQALNRGIEALVREAPEQYQWEYKRFKKHCPMQAEKRYQFKS